MMTLYLVQHGAALSKDEDPERPLTERGRGEVARVGRAAARVGIGVHHMYHSGKLRAEQTAELLAAELDPAHSPAPMDGLAPTDDPGIVEKALEQLDAPTMLVGHLPHLSRLASRLVAGDAEADVIAFRNGGIVCLRQGDDARWRVAWVLTPELARS